MSENTEIAACLDRAIELARDQLEAWSGSQQNRSDIAVLIGLRDAIKAGPTYWTGEGSEMATSAKVKDLMRKSGLPSRFGDGQLNIPLYAIPTTAVGEGR